MGREGMKGMWHNRHIEALFMWDEIIAKSAMKKADIETDVEMKDRYEKGSSGETNGAKDAGSKDFGANKLTNGEQEVTVNGKKGSDIEMTTNNHAKESSGETDDTEESDWRTIGAAGLMRGDPPRPLPRTVPTREHTGINGGGVTSTLEAKELEVKELEAAAVLAALALSGPDGKEGRLNGNGHANGVVNGKTNGANGAAMIG